MFKRPLLLAFSLCLPSAAPALAEKIQFICHSEESADAIASAAVKTHTRSEAIAQRRLMMGKCWFLDKKVFVYVVRRGTTFGTTFKVTVVGLSQKMGEFPVMWSLMPSDELYDDGTI
jgi:hypothetical protein